VVDTLLLFLEISCEQYYIIRFCVIMLAAPKRVINNCQSVSSGVRRGVDYGVTQFGFYLSEESQIKN